MKLQPEANPYKHLNKNMVVGHCETLYFYTTAIQFFILPLFSKEVSHPCTPTFIDFYTLFFCNNETQTCVFVGF